MNGFLKTLITFVTVITGLVSSAFLYISDILRSAVINFYSMYACINKNAHFDNGYLHGLARQTFGLEFVVIPLISLLIIGANIVVCLKTTNTATRALATFNVIAMFLCVVVCSYQLNEYDRSANSFSVCDGNRMRIMAYKELTMLGEYGTQVNGTNLAEFVSSLIETGSFQIVCPTAHSNIYIIGGPDQDVRCPIHYNP